MDRITFLQSIPTSNLSGKFATDLYLTLQQGIPLTLIQKIFLFVLTVIPGPFSWKLKVFEYISSPAFSQLLVVLALLSLVIVLLYLIRKVSWRFILKKEQLVFLELTFPSLTDKTAFATEQLFAFLHNLALRQSLIKRLLGYKKQYSLEIVASKEGGIRYILGLTKTDAPIIQKSLLSYLPGLKLSLIHI